MAMKGIYVSQTPQVMVEASRIELGQKQYMSEPCSTLGAALQAVISIEPVSFSVRVCAQQRHDNHGNNRGDVIGRLSPTPMASPLKTRHVAVRSGVDAQPFMPFCTSRLFLSPSRNVSVVGNNNNKEHKSLQQKHNIHNNTIFLTQICFKQVDRV